MRPPPWSLSSCIWLVAATCTSSSIADAFFVLDLSLAAGCVCRCTAVTAVVVGDRLLVANVGDSRAVLSRDGRGGAGDRDSSSWGPLRELILGPLAGGWGGDAPGGYIAGGYIGCSCLPRRYPVHCNTAGSCHDSCLASWPLPAAVFLPAACCSCCALSSAASLYFDAPLHSCLGFLPPPTLPSLRLPLRLDCAAVPMSVDHKPNSKEERTRIEDAGGVVVWAGTWRVGGVLAVSRAFGDRPLKRYVIPTPDIREEVLSSSDDCLILASDGLWDVVSNQVSRRRGG